MCVYSQYEDSNIFIRALIWALLGFLMVCHLCSLHRVSLDLFYFLDTYQAFSLSYLLKRIQLLGFNN